MKYRKYYGRSKIIECPFCSKQAIAKNKQDVPTCIEHKDQNLPDLKCACGSWLDLLVSKHGPYFRCFKCGNVKWQRAIEINGKPTPQNIEKKEIKQKSVPEKTKKQYVLNNHTKTYGYAKIESKNKKEVFIRSDEVDFI
ncbi:hypothetical protein COV16_07210 [Candidatus Woesearchaeota archaeon CG10_big_fil_rev_8_21_14_0_10_34_8]|nr:MAG: hypothetical protein COV16_07210 [Candidatus Woesearchaeota archaeon CG10_big_fil_rev_8_21_14_0_10_34_8]